MKRVNTMTVNNLPIDIFAHVLAPKFHQEMLKIDSKIPDEIPYANLKALFDMDFRRENIASPTRQIISMVNLNPEDYVDPDLALKLCESGNFEIESLIKENPDMFIGGIAMVPMNNLSGSLSIMKTVAKSDDLYGIQLFTRALGKSIADPAYEEIFAKAEQLNLPILLHPVFDERKPDNNIVFSWEYELSQAMLQIVQAGIFEKYPNVKIIVHHAGALAPFFAGRIERILSKEQAGDFKKFYVDTAILGNPSAIKLTMEYFGVKHVLFGTDAPFGLPPVGATHDIIEAVNGASDEWNTTKQILFENAIELLNLNIN